MGRRLRGATRSTLSLVVVALLLTDPIWAWGSGKKGGSSSGKSQPKQPTQSGTSHGRQPTQTGTRQPSKPDPYPKGGYYPGGGTNTNQQNPSRGGNTNQQNPGWGGTNQQYPGQGQGQGQGGTNYGRNPNQQYPGQGGTNYGGGQPNQPYPGQGGTNYGGQPYQPGQGGTNYGRNPNQPYPGQGGQPYQPQPGQGGTNYGRNPYQPYPGQGGQPYQPQPGQGGTNYGRNPNQQHPGWGQGGTYGGGHGYGGGGGYGYGQGGGYGGYGGGYGYPNRNPNNQILSPRYGGGGYGGMGGGSPFSRSVQGHGYQPSVKSQGFAKKAMLAAGVGAVAGMAVGYGIGRFPQPHFGFRSPQEEQHYNRYMYERYGSQSNDKTDYRDYVYKTPTAKADKNFRTFEKHMESCMKRTDLLRQQEDSSSPDRSNVQNDQSQANTNGLQDPDMSNPQINQSANTDGLKDAAGLELNSTQESQAVSAAGTGGVDANSTQGTPSVSEKDVTASPVAGRDKRAADAAAAVAVGDAGGDDRVVSITEIGYPALIDQLKSRRCMELYMVYSEQYLQKQAQQQTQDPDPDQRQKPKSRGDTSGRPLVLLLTTTVMLLCSNILLQ